MRRLIVVVAALLALNVMSAVAATVSSASVCQGNGTGCTKAGTYSENAVINSDYGGVFKVVWTKSVVKPYSSGQPLYWTAYVTYTNISSSDQTLNCTGDGSSVSSGIAEYMSGGSGDDGMVPAETSLCDQDPGFTKTVPPGHSSTDWGTFHNVPWPGSAVSIAWGDVGTSPGINPAFGPWDTDWANSSFCSRHWVNKPKGAAYIGVTYKGVAACGNSEKVGNNQGPIYYTTPAGTKVWFDNGSEPGTGFQCVELVARYFYFETAKAPPVAGTGSEFVQVLHQEYSGYGVYPATGPSKGGTNAFKGSLTAGNIISMWSSSDPTGAGHVAVVTYVSPGVNSSGNGYIDVIDENGGGKLTSDGLGDDQITVKGGQMFYYGLYNRFQWTTNLPGSG